MDNETSFVEPANATSSAISTTLRGEFSALRVMRLTAAAILPTRAYPNDAGLDIYGIEDTEIAPRQGQALATGIAIALPPGFVGLVADRSSLAKKGLKCAGGVIDAGYRGEIRIVLWNLSDSIIVLKRGERIAQLLILPIATPAVLEVSIIDDTQRGTGGFGSSGK